MAAGRLKDPVNVLQRQSRPGRIVGTGQDDDGRSQLADRGHGGLDVEREVLAARAGDVVGQGVADVLGVHRVRGGEGQAGAPGASEGLEHVEHDLVGAVGGPDLLRGQVHAGLGLEVVRERLPQPGEVALRVAVEALGGPSHGGGDRLDDFHRGRVGVLVDVQPHRDVDLRGAVGRLALQVRSQGQVRAHGLESTAPSPGMVGIRHRMGHHWEEDPLSSSVGLAGQHDLLEVEAVQGVLQ